MKEFFAFIILALSAVIAVYVGGYLMFYSGLTFLIELFIDGGSVLSVPEIALAIMKVFFAGLAGWLIVFLGMVLVGIISEA
jgi:hypothetical protein